MQLTLSGCCGYGHAQTRCLRLAPDHSIHPSPQSQYLGLFSAPLTVPTCLGLSRLAHGSGLNRLQVSVSGRAPAMSSCSSLSPLYPASGLGTRARCEGPLINAPRFCLFSPAVALTPPSCKSSKCAAAFCGPFRIWCLYLACSEWRKYSATPPSCWARCATGRSPLAQPFVPFHHFFSFVDTFIVPVFCFCFFNFEQM